MRAPKRDPKDFEKVKVGEFVTGIIKDIEYDEKHDFKGKYARIGPAIRLVFELDGYKFPHKTRWMTFNLGEKSNLYLKYVAKLVKDAKPDLDMDLDELKGMKVKTIWAEDNDYQSVESIFPQGEKLVVALDHTLDDVHKAMDDSEDDPPIGEVPF